MHSLPHIGCSVQAWKKTFTFLAIHQTYLTCKSSLLRVLPRRELFWKFLALINTLGHHLFSNSKPNLEHIPLFRTHCCSLASCIIYEYIGKQKCVLINRCLSQCDTHHQIFSLSLIQQTLAVLQCRVTILSYYPPMHVKNLHSCKALILFTVGVSILASDCWKETSHLSSLKQELKSFCQNFFSLIFYSLKSQFSCLGNN